MMKTPISRWGLSAAAVALGLCTSAWALSVIVNVAVPGVDAGGNLDPGLGATIPMRANVNTNTGAVRASGRGTVTNQSGRTQHYQNVPVDIPDVTITSNRYTVNVRGKCVAIAAGVVNLPE